MPVFKARYICATAIVACLTALGGVVAFSPDASAKRPVPSYVKNACARDYSRFCSAYLVPSIQLEKCMRSHARQLSCRCARALVRAGRARRSTLRKRRPRC